ncbi:hypothetical protein ITJ43_13365 [Microbacterium sp. VKM Ac-2870]|uniref:hypothetical protein n=1 Tax=Microbacterium sp. VKM Ac-2870 TaxID=2783825 RepID=UPI00188D7B81|nr:hypothetical protein [Microbacterium sp. VKM Ac-2870]MBF4563122.1 hypothetical protein [Microbacterium sp. VKM Ac-2870]
MHHVTVRIEDPQVADVFAYRSWLFALTFDGQVLAYTVGELAAQLSSRHGADGRIASYALFSSKGIGADEALKSEWRQYDHARSISLRLGPGSHLDLGFRAESLAVLDMHVYYNKIYVATDQGTWMALLQKSGRDEAVIGEPHRITNDATESLSAGMGAVAASLGRNGLAVFLDAWVGGSGRQQRIERESLRSTLGWGRAINYPTDSSYQTLDVERRQHKGRPVLDTVKAPEGDPVELSDGSYALWESGRLLVGDAAGTSSLGQDRESSRSKVIAERADRTVTRRPLWIGPTGNGLIVTETAEALEAGRGSRLMTIYRGEIGSVRTFPGSQRYRRLIAATVEGGLLLSAVFRDDDDND